MTWETSEDIMRASAQLVIAGAGIVGCSAAYHLARLGWHDFVVIDQGPLFETGGSTSHAPGLIFQTNSSKMMCEFAMTTVGLMKELDRPDRPVWFPVGGIEIAYTPERLLDLKRRQGWATAYGLEAHLVSPAEVRQMIPLLDDRVILGGYFVPTDGDAKAVNAAVELARIAAAQGGVEFIGHNKVLDIVVKEGRVRAAITEQGRIDCENVLLCTNIWAPVLGARTGVNIPLMAVEHLYAVTTPVPELAGESREIAHPILRHQDHAGYYRQHGERYGLGSYQHKPLLVDPHDLGKTAMRPFTPEHFAETWASTIELFPALKHTQIERSFNGMFAFTVDGFPVLGPAPEVGGLWVAAGVWVTHSGGVGKAMAEWMTAGAPQCDLREADISRFHPHVFSRRYIQARCATQYDEVYDIIHPKQPLEHPRNLRLSPVHSHLQALGGVFFESAGWERPQWFAANARLLENYDQRIPHRTGWAERFWSRIEGAEHLATREHAALFDLCAFTKIEVTGPGAAAYLNYLAANQIDRGIGKVVYTALLNQNGGIKCDLTITRLGRDHFWVLTGGGTGMQDLAWLRANAPADGSVHIADVTSQYGALGLWGSRARDVLARVCEDDVANAAFPYFTARRITIDAVPALALRLSYAGELGWELYARAETMQRLWEALWEAGQPYGLVAAGGGAFDSLRLEKGYRLWGADIHTEYTPFEAGLGWAVRLDKGDFLGREALLRAQEAGARRKLCCLTFAEPGAVALGKEPIVVGDKKLGYVTSANFGYSVGRFILYGYLPVEYAAAGGEVDVIYFGKRQRAIVTDEPLFDPEMTRLKA